MSDFELNSMPLNSGFNGYEEENDYTNKKRNENRNRNEQYYGYDDDDDDDTTTKKSSALTSFLYVIGQVAILAVYVLGLCSLNGKEVSVLTIIDVILSIFSINLSMWYQYLSSLIHGIMYLIFGVKMLKEFFTGFRKWKDKDCDEIEKTFKMLLKNATMYLILSAALNHIELTFLGTVGYIACVAILAVGCITKQMSSGEGLSIGFIVTKPTVIVLKAIVIMMLSNLFMTDVVDGVINGFSLLGSVNFEAGSGAIYIIFEGLILPIFRVVFTYRILNIVCDICDDNIVEESLHFKALMKLVITVLIVDLILYIGVAGITSSTAVTDKLLDYFEIAKTTFIPLVLLGVAGFAVSKQEESN